MKKTKLVAILNLTPNSFSDGGLFINPENAKKQLELLLRYGADIIDIGAISTRPNSLQPSIKEEIERYNKILSVITPILKEANVEISIDSYNFETLEYLSKHIPIHWINDQKGFLDLQMVELAKNIKAKIVIMHHLTIPADSNVVIPKELNVTDEVKKWLLEKANYLMNQGIESHNIILDPGIGFNKTAQQSWQLIREAKKLTSLGFSVMYGHSRKSFLNLITEKEFKDRDFETAVVSYYLAQAEVAYLRVHNVESNLQALNIQEFLG